MTEKHTFPINGLNSDDQFVSIAEQDIGKLVQIAGWDRFATAASSHLAMKGLALPDDYRKANHKGGITVWRIAPDRVLVRSQDALGFESNDETVVLDLSEARVCLAIEGLGSAGLLSRVIALDFSELAFPVGAFAQTALHHVGVLVERHAVDRFVLLVPTTWALSLTSLLSDHLLKAA